jgi:hypothetical protein
MLWGEDGYFVATNNTTTHTATTLEDGFCNTSLIANCYSGKALASSCDMTDITMSASCPGTLDESTYAAGLCADYSIDSNGHSPCAGGYCYDDWFLPSYNQLQCIYTNNASISSIFNYAYWTSTEQQSTEVSHAWFLFSLNGNFVRGDKTLPLPVRCARAIDI